MRVLALLSLIPFLATTSAAPKPAAAPEPYNPFFPHKFQYDTAHTVDRRQAISQSEMDSRAEIERAGLAKMEEVEGNTKRHVNAKRGTMRKIRRVSKSNRRKRGSTCAVQTTSVAAGVTTTSVVVPSAAASSIPSASVSTSFIGGGAIAQPSSSSLVQSSVQPSAQESSYVSSAVITSVQITSTSVPASSATSVAASSAVASTTSSASTPVETAYTVDPAGNGPFSGWGTYFADGLSACGTYDTPGMPIVAVSAELFDSWPGYDGTNPNNNPICGLHLDITWGGKTLTVEVTDRCPGCAVRSLDLSEGAFHYFAPYSVGLLGMADYTGNITWSWTEGTGRLPLLPY